MILNWFNKTLVFISFFHSNENNKKNVLNYFCIFQMCKGFDERK